MKKFINIVLGILIVILLVAVFQRIQVSDTTTIGTTDYWYEEMAIQYLYYIK